MHLAPKVNGCACVPVKTHCVKSFDIEKVDIETSEKMIRKKLLCKSLHFSHLCPSAIIASSMLSNFSLTVYIYVCSALSESHPMKSHYGYCGGEGTCMDHQIRLLCSFTHKLPDESVAAVYLN